MNPVRYLADSSDHFDPVYLDEIIARYLPGDTLSQSFLATDFDGTMVEDDVGIQVFLQKLLDPRFWTENGNGHTEDDEAKDFQDVLLPTGHLKLLQEGKLGKISGADIEKCQFALDLAEDITALYKAIQKQVKSSEFPDEIDIAFAEKHPLINEFARKMIALDQVMMDLESVFSERLNGEFLLRTRFFQNRRIPDIREITNRIFSTTQLQVTLAINDDTPINGTPRKVKSDHPLLGKNAISMRLKPTTNNQTLATVYNLLRPPYPPIPRVITTNIPTAVDTVIKATDWREVLHRPDHLIEWEDPLIQGTRLLKDPNTWILQPRAKDRPVAGERKTEIAEAIAHYHRRQFRIALGDTPRGDLAMGIRAMENDGIFFVVPASGQRQENPQQAIENSRRRFADFISHTLGKNLPPTLRERMFYQVPEQV